jgi:hypothetical protein
LKNFVCPGYHGREPFSRFLLAAGSTGLLLERFSKKVSSVFADCSGKKLEKKRNSLSIFLGSRKRPNSQKLTKFPNYADLINWTILCMIESMKN